MCSLLEQTPMAPAVHAVLLAPRAGPASLSLACRWGPSFSSSCAPCTCPPLCLAFAPTTGKPTEAAARDVQELSKALSRPPSDVFHLTVFHHMLSICRTLRTRRRASPPSPSRSRFCGAGGSAGPTSSSQSRWAPSSECSTGAGVCISGRGRRDGPPAQSQHDASQWCWARARSSELLGARDVCLPLNQHELLHMPALPQA